MASKNTLDYYKDLRGASTLRIMAETLLNSSKIKKINGIEAYDMARKQAGVEETDLPIYKEIRERLGLASNAKVLVDNHGHVVGRSAKARKIYKNLDLTERELIDSSVREGIYKMQKNSLVKTEGIIGMDKNLMLKATLITTEDNVNNLFNWLINFTPFDNEVYKESKKLNLQDIIVVSYNDYLIDNEPMSLIDYENNTIFVFGLRYFGELKKGTLTLAWSSGLRIGLGSCHGGIKEVNFNECAAEYKILNKKVIAFYGLSGTGKSSHTNSFNNKNTLPSGVCTKVIHDDAFQFDLDEERVYAWEPSLFDKTSDRDINHKDWKYTGALMNHGLVEINNKTMPLAMDLRQGNGRGLFDRSMIGEWKNSSSLPNYLVWLMKDETLPPVIRFSNPYLAVAMGACLITKRNKAENIDIREMDKLVFEPFANPFRVYKLREDVEMFLKLINKGVETYTFNSGGYYIDSKENLEDISLKTSLTLQSAILTDRLEWEPWSLVKGAMVPTKESVEKLIPGYFDKYSVYNREINEDYKTLLKGRFESRRKFLEESDLVEDRELLEKLLNSIKL